MKTGKIKFTSMLLGMMLIAAMAFTYSIGDGLTLGVLSYVVINLLYNLIAPKEERKRISAVMVVLALLFVLKLIYL